MKRFARYERRNPPDEDKAKRRKSFDMFGIVGGCTELENPELEAVDSGQGRPVGGCGCGVRQAQTLKFESE